MHTLEQTIYQEAQPDINCVYLGKNVRFTMITSRLIRFEYAEDGVFEDRQTLAVLKRNLGKTRFSITADGDWHVIDTGDVVIRYLPDGKKLTRKNLSATFKLNGKEVKWYPGASAKGNLKGTIRTLDRCSGDTFFQRGKYRELYWTKFQLNDGFLSKDGWSLIDDSQNVAITWTKDGKWVEPRPEKDLQDFYLLAYGHDYKTALADAAGVFGSQPLPPRYTLGYWYCRYWAHSDIDFEEIVSELDASETPIDVVVIDMDWHLEGWTGYTWDKRYFPDPDEFLAELHRRGCRVSLNLHPADGVGRHEADFEAMAKAMNLDPKKIGKAGIPFNITDPNYMQAYFKVLHHPQEDRGVDFWWMDWQQGKTTAMRNLDTLPWINHLHWEDMQKRGKRPLIFSRFGGVGSGRYVIGFSGDTFSNWESLAYQPGFTATAANVLYGYWSHDIGGHMPGVVEPELYLRWMQFGIFTPILRTHTSKYYPADRRFSAFPEPYRALMLKEIRKRYEMVPYIYSENRRALDTGISLVSPLYYEYPETPEAYSEKKSFFFGSQFIVSPVVKPVDKVSEMSTEKIWLPEGEWFDTTLGKTLKGGRYHTLSYMLDETPVFARSGAIVPGERGVKRLTEKSYSNLIVNVYPGKSGSYDLYEDDGITPDYLEENFAVINFAHKKSGNRRLVTVKHLGGSFDGFLTERELEFRLHGVVPPEEVKLNGKKVDFAYRFTEEHPAEAIWRYDGTTATVIVRTPAVDIMNGAELEVSYAGEDEFSAADGIAGIFRRLKLAAKVHNAFGQHQYVVKVDERLGQELAHTGYRISHKPETFAAEMANLRKKLPRLPREIVLASPQIRSRFEGADPSDWVKPLMNTALATLKLLKKEYF